MKLSILAVTLALLPCSSHAQQVTSAQARVRLSTVVFGTEPFQLIGTLVRLDSDTLVIESEHDHNRIALPVASIRRFEMSEGPRRRTGRGALYGLIGGVVIGAGSVLVICELEEDGCYSTGLAGNWTAFTATLAGLGLGLLGTGVGAIVGSTIRTERWQQLSLDHLRLGFGGARRFQAGLRFTF